MTTHKQQHSWSLQTVCGRRSRLGQFAMGSTLRGFCGVSIPSVEDRGTLAQTKSLSFHKGGSQLDFHSINRRRQLNHQSSNTAVFTNSFTELF